jgi:hypothetical protein
MWDAARAELGLLPFEAIGTTVTAVVTLAFSLAVAATGGQTVEVVGDIELPSIEIDAGAGVVVMGAVGLKLEPRIEAVANVLVAGSAELEIATAIEGVGNQRIEGVGLFAFARPVLTAAGNAVFVGAGGLELPVLEIAGAGTQVHVGVGSLFPVEFVVTGAGSPRVTGVGSVKLPAPILTGEAPVRVVGVGTLALPLALEGSGYTITLGWMEGTCFISLVPVGSLHGRGLLAGAVPSSLPCVGTLYGDGLLHGWVSFDFDVQGRLEQPPRLYRRSLPLVLAAHRAAVPPEPVAEPPGLPKPARPAIGGAHVMVVPQALPPSGVPQDRGFRRFAPPPRASAAA